jgi:hypothetical protein
MRLLGRSIFVIAAVLCNPASHAQNVLKSTGDSYVDDHFDSAGHSNQLWHYASCLMNQPHGARPTSGGPGLAYPILGQASRKGYCGFETDGAGPAKNTYIRFITMPFDRRDADTSKDNFLTSVDRRKGGSEMRARKNFVYDAAKNKQGWDFYGKTYLNPSNTVGYYWNFRLSDVSMLLPNNKGIKLAGAAVVGQFHSQTAAFCNVTEKYVPRFSPAPGLDVRAITVKNPTTGFIEEKLQFDLFSKITNAQAKEAGLACSDQPDDICKVHLWKGVYPLSLVAKRSLGVAGVAPWISVSYIMRSSKTNGAMKFSFGVDPAKYPAIVKEVPELAYAERKFLNGASVLKAPTTQNECPNQPFLGSYVLAYATQYYGYPTDAEFPRARSNSATESQKNRPIRSNQVNPSRWVRSEFANDYGKFIMGAQEAGQFPPQFVVDYDDFRILQEDGLP